MYTNVIVGVDGEQWGRDAAALAGILAAPGAHLLLVYVSTTPNAELEDEFADEDALAALLHEELELCGGDVHLARVTALSIAAGLADVVEQRQADLIVLGASHRRGLTRLFAGDHVISVIHQTPCTVAVAPAGFAQNATTLGRIGVAYDGSPEGEVALAHAGMLAAEHHSDLIAGHAVAPQLDPQGHELSPLMVDDSAIRREPPPQPLGDADGVQVQDIEGPPRKALLEFSRSVDLLVCGSRRNGPVRRIVLGSTSEGLARHPQTALLVAPAGDAATVDRWRAHRQTASA
jgi:nucleotide-binding universal stress UspA family protein